MEKSTDLRDKYRLKENDPVAHIENLEQKMIVKEIKRRTVFVSTGETDAENGGFKKVKKNKIDGILVYWFENKVYQEKKFHSNMLIPYSIAEQGKEAVEKWLKEKELSNLK
jgi:hypothetical protein